MPLNVRERQAVVKMAERCRKATKVEKGRVLTQVCQLYDRLDAARTLRPSGRSRSGGGTTGDAGPRG